MVVTGSSLEPEKHGEGPLQLAHVPLKPFA